MNFLRTIRNAILTASSPFARKFHAGHYYSPLPDMGDVARLAARGAAADEDLPGIELNERAQIDLLSELSRYQSEIPYLQETPTYRYTQPNGYYPLGDAVVLMSLMRHFKPERIIEVGSGYSSAVMLDTGEIFPEKMPSMTIIDPFPERMVSLSRPGDDERMNLITKPVQSVPLKQFEELSAGDFLFIDSSHVSKIGSDVNFLVFQVLPRLKDGVIIHFHDVYWPFEYPLEVFREGIAWNENYLIHAFLEFNPKFTMLLFMQYLLSKHWKAVHNTLPLCVEYGGSSLWLIKQSTQEI